MDVVLITLGEAIVKNNKIDFFLRKTLIRQKKLKKVFTSKDYFSKLQIRQRCRENKRKSK